MSEELKTIKFQLMLAPSEAQAIDDWGFSHRIRTRAEAIRRLCQIGIVANRYLEKVSKIRPEMRDSVGEIIDAIHSETEVYSERWLIQQLLDVHENTVELSFLLEDLAEITTALGEGESVDTAVANAAKLEAKRAAAFKKWRTGMDNIKAMSLDFPQAAADKGSETPDVPNDESREWDWENSQTDRPQPVEKSTKQTGKRQKR